MQRKTCQGGDEALMRAWVALLAFQAITAPTAFANAEATAAAANLEELEADRLACMDLQGRMIGGSRIVAATFAYPPFQARWMGSTRTAVARVPFCRLEGHANPSPRSHSEFEVWLPARDAWNGRLLGVGAGGSMGDVNRPDLIGAVSRGYAAVATDNGHRSAGPRDGNQWALGQWERVIDFGYRAQKLSTAAAKAAISAYYGRPPKFSYFAGCSQGGQKALMAAQRHPTDYDGILAGAPVYSWSDLMTQQAWNVRAFTETPKSALSVQQMQALQDAVTRRCGGPNGLVNDPLNCRFDPGELQCPQQGGSVSCLSPEQVIAVRKVYAGPRTSSGTQILPGYSRGGERGWEQFYAQVRADGTEGGGSWLGVYRYMVFQNPAWNLQQLHFDEDPALAKRKLGPVLDADSPDLDAFAARGGKLIVYQGWADQQLPAETSLQYHSAVVARLGQEKTDGFYRLFMVPGMAHCFPESVAATAAAPRGPNLVPHPEYDPSVPATAENDALTALQEWVEHGRAPQQFVVRIRNESAGIAERTVRTCAEPYRAAFRDTGNPLEASTWACVATEGRGGKER